MSIRLLDNSTIAKIAAGEIIENPASIVKELLENAIDAGALNIVIEVRGEIGSFLRITDDGDGILKDEIELAFMRHSTSKLSQAEDLFNIMSLGFRGEALASISTISHVELLTKHKDEKVGTRAIVENGEVIEKKNVGLPKGTTFYIKDVFYNTPVRKRYLKSNNSEFNYIEEVVEKIALSKSDISIKLIRDGKIIINTNRDLDLKNHIYTLLGRDITSNLIEHDFKSESYKIKAFFSNNKLYRSNRNHQYVYVNGRYVKNLDISRHIEKKYYSLIPLNRYPIFILFIDIDPILVDVNIHPKKHEVKLSNENNLLAILGEMVDDVLYPNREIERPLLDESKKKEDEETKNVTVFELFGKEKISEDICDSISSKQNFSSNKDNLIEENKLFDENSIPISQEQNFYKYEDIVAESEDYLNSDKKFDSAIFEKPRIEYGQVQDNCEKPKSEIEVTSVNFVENFTDEFENSAEEKKSQIDESLTHTRIVGTLFKTFIILENARDDKTFLIDQHAAHERVMYEKFKYQYENSEIAKQILLKPELIELTSEEKNNIIGNLDVFKSIGFDIDVFGQNSIIVREVPMLFGLPSYLNFIYDVINALSRDISSGYEVEPYKIMKKACKAAVKAGDKLSDMEIGALVKQLIKCENPYTCPHGRPTIIEMTKRDLEKMFLREV